MISSVFLMISLIPRWILIIAMFDHDGSYVECEIPTHLMIMGMDDYHV